MKGKPVGSGNAADKDIYYKNYVNEHGVRYQILGNQRTGKATVKRQSPTLGSSKYEARNETYAEQAARRKKEAAKEAARRVKEAARHKTAGSQGPKKAATKKR